MTMPGLGEAAGEFDRFRKSELAGWVRDRLVERELTRFALVGHDWGGTVAVHVAAVMPRAVVALVVEEEILPGVDVEIPAPGSERYPTWHGPFNRVHGLAEQLVPGREAAYYGTFLEESAGPGGLEPMALRAYIDAYTTPGVLESGLGYYCTRVDDIVDVKRLHEVRVHTPVLAIGGRYAMGSAVAEGLRPVAPDVTALVLDQSGHYPLEQEPGLAGRAIIEFLRRHAAETTAR